MLWTIQGKGRRRRNLGKKLNGTTSRATLTIPSNPEFNILHFH